MPGQPTTHLPTDASADSSLELGIALLTATDSGARATLIASSVLELVEECACVVHRLLEQGEISAFVAVGLAGSVALAESSMPVDRRLLAPLFTAEPPMLLYDRDEIEREDYAHLNIGRSVVSLAYLPILNRDSLVGVIEMLAFAAPMNSGDLDLLAPIAALAGPALLAAEEFERQRQDLLDSVHRMSQLYDLEKSLNATLELDEVTTLAPEKTVAMFGCQAIHLWLFESGVLRLMASSGADATVEQGMTQAAGDGYVGEMAEEGEALLLDDPEDERLLRRNAVLGDPPETPPIVTALLIPLMQEEAEIGVLEAVNKTGGEPFDDDDQFFLSAMAETVSNALKNSSLMHAERKLEILEALVHVSSEITSTLRLDRLLQIIVNSPQSVLPFDRCTIALDNRGTLQLKAVSGLASIPMGDLRVDQLHALVRWLSSESGALHLTQHDEPDEDLSEEQREDREAAAPDSDLPDAVAGHFAATGYRALYALPLLDDQGRVGLLLYEAADPDFLDLPHTEMIKILAGQATVAIRNALLYREVPLISLLEPLVQRKQALFRTSRNRRLGFAVGLTVVALFLIFCPLPMRISGVALVAPQHLVTVAAPVDGTVAQVYVHEGQRVAAGEPLGQMNDWQWRLDLASAEAKYRAAELAMEASLSRGSSQAGEDRAQVEFLRAELARSRSRVEGAELRSPIAGVVATPALQNAAGEHLNAGDSFAQVLDLSSAVVDIAVPQSDIGLVQAGERAAIKLDSYPQLSWRGPVVTVSPQAQATEADRTFAARVEVPNGDAMLRSGMSGRAKISIGLKPAGYVLLRRPALWLWQTLWNWIGW